MEMKKVVKAAIGAGLGLLGGALVYAGFKKSKQNDANEANEEETEAGDTEVSED